MMTATGGAMENHFGAVDETTKRLVGRCERVGWLNDDYDDDHDRARGEGEGKVARKLLNVEMPAGMGSSLSVLEVTVQKERPGVLTGSRDAEERERERAQGILEQQSDVQVNEDGGTIGGETTRVVDTTITGTLPEKSPFEVEGEA